MRRIIIGASIFLLAVPFLGHALQNETQPSQRLDPKIQKIVSEISADRIAEIEKKRRKRTHSQANDSYLSSGHRYYDVSVPARRAMSTS